MHYISHIYFSTSYLLYLNKVHYIQIQIRVPFLIIHAISVISFKSESKHTFSILYFSRAWVAQSTASCCISSDISAFFITAFLSDILIALKHTESKKRKNLNTPFYASFHWKTFNVKIASLLARLAIKKLAIFLFLYTEEWKENTNYGY